MRWYENLESLGQHLADEPVSLVINVKQILQEIDSGVSQFHNSNMSATNIMDSMGKLTGTVHGVAANALLAFYDDKVKELAAAGQYFMAAVALGLALETVLLTYLLVEFGDDNGGELEIPDSVGMSDLIETANHFDVLNAPISGQSHVRADDRPPKHVAKDVVDTVRSFRNLVHPARALKEGYDPRKFTSDDFENLKEMYDSVIHSLMYYL